MIEVLYSPTDHGRSVHVTICRSTTGHREDLTRFVCTQGDWFELKLRFEAGEFTVRKDDFYARQDEAMFA